MSVAVKMRHTEVVIGTQRPKKYLVPVTKAHSIQKLIEEYRVEDDDELLDADEALQELFKDLPKPAALLQGYRTRDGFTQVKLAKKLKTSQSAIAAMESGARPIGKNIAQKLAKIFHADYRSFL